MPPPSSSSKTSSTSSNCSSSVPRHGGELEIAVLSLDHLPKNNLSHVSLSACGQTSVTGPPPCKDPVQIVHKSLKNLYEASFVLEVVYEENPSNNWRVTYPVKNLGVNQLHHLILDLEPTTTSSTHPTIQIQAQLKGAYRREIRFAVRLASAWFAIMDALERNVKSAFLAALLLTPFVGALLLLALPMAFPFVALALTGAAAVCLAFPLLLASTSRGRRYCYRLLHPLIQSSPGQSALYPIGPRPTPVDAVECVLPRGRVRRLIISIAIDFIGCSSFFMPGLGEASDLVWAPLQTLLIMALYNETSPRLKYLSFAEELLPFTDVVPSATIGWMAQFGPELLGRTEEVPEDLKLKEN